MPISETTRLNAIYGTGTLIGLSATGFLIVPRIGKQNTIRLGCLSVATCFGLIILSGLTGNPIVFKSALMLFGLASGIATTGALSLMLDLTAAEKKATYEEIKAYVLEHTGLKVSSLYIAQVKQKCGIIERENYNKPKSEDAKQPQCPPEKESAITEALKHFGMI